VDLSALIFVALAVAWAVYLVPKALKHHDEVARSRTVDRFSHTVRVLARREVADKKSTTLVTPAQQAAQQAAQQRVQQEAQEAAAQPTPGQLQARRAAAKRATARRRNVLALLLLANAVVIALAAFAVLAWPFVAIPAGLLVAWLVACRLMVKGERKALRPAAGMPVETPKPAEPERVGASAAEQPVEEADDVDPMVDTSAGIAAIVDPAMWDPVPVTLPTYVGKPAAARSVRTIDLDATGVWTSGRTDADAQIAREADEADKAARKARRDGDDQRAVGS